MFKSLNTLQQLKPWYHGVGSFGGSEFLSGSGTGLCVWQGDVRFCGRRRLRQRLHLRLRVSENRRPGVRRDSLRPGHRSCRQPKMLLSQKRQVQVKRSRFGVSSCQGLNPAFSSDGQRSDTIFPPTHEAFVFMCSAFFIP
ncbi:uncharacterized protein LOC128746489 isoform X1 [Synchiropus splendidus]|uniref:uncharacterized protein LOC128746489 isoform X1 n=1 Tax=Synchiropus splendidus TaxID=270530 RepID=UPI00237D525F|nr:uncharacterized protein LOC128746489 isoform X1 [Synchiropus splendidus]